MNRPRQYPFNGEKSGVTEEILPSASAWVWLAAGLIRCMPADHFRAIERLCRRPPNQFRM